MLLRRNRTLQSVTACLAVVVGAVGATAFFAPPADCDELEQKAKAASPAGTRYVWQQVINAAVCIETLITRDPLPELQLQ